MVVMCTSGPVPLSVQCRMLKSVCQIDTGCIKTFSYTIQCYTFTLFNLYPVNCYTFTLSREFHLSQNDANATQSHSHEI